MITVRSRHCRVCATVDLNCRIRGRLAVFINLSPANWRAVCQVLSPMGAISANYTGSALPREHRLWFPLGRFRFRTHIDDNSEWQHFRRNSIELEEMEHY